MANFKKDTVKANDINFHYMEMGEGPLVLCLHGFPSNAYSFRFLLPALAGAGFRAVAPFMRGYAPTEQPKDGRYDTPLLGKDTLALITALGAERGAIVGNDWGAYAGWGAAVIEPEKLTKLVTIATVHPAAAESRNYEYLKGQWHSFYFQMPSADQTMAHDDFAFIDDWYKDAAPGWDAPKDAKERVKETFRKPGTVQAALGYYRSRLNTTDQMMDLQERIDMSTIPVPTLALHGDQDRPRRLEAFQNIDRVFTGGLEKAVVPGTGHFMHEEAPDQVNPLIVDFLKR